MLIKSVVGLTTLKTMKIKGKIVQQEIVVLINCGTTHNLLSTSLVEKLSLHKTRTNGYGILIGIGMNVKVKEFVKVWCSPGKILIL